MKSNEQKIKKVFDSVTRNRQIFESVLLMENASGDFSYHLEYGGKKLDSPILTASITKLFTTTCIFMLREQEKLSLDDKLTKFFDGKMLSDLHLYKGQEYSEELTIFHLLSHTSGLPDVIEEGSSQAKKRAMKKDRYIHFDESILNTKQSKPHFKPGTGKRAHYANVNFDILGKIIEIVTDSPLEDVYQQFIFDPLELKDTYLPIKEDDFVPSVYYQDTSFYLPKTLRSIRASGGCVSTVSDLMIFMKAFFGGKLFQKTMLQELESNNKLQFAMSPIRYGAGFMKVPLDGLVTLFIGKGELLGHSGSTGSFAFYYPRADLFFVGDFNQMANPALPIRFAMRLAMSLKV